MVVAPARPGSENFESELTRHRSDGPGSVTRLKQYLLLGSLFVLPDALRVRALYAMDSTFNLFGEQSLYRNLGYWKDTPKSLDDACQAMAQLLGETAGFGPGDEILDVGPAFGDQDMYWLDRFSPRRIVALDIIPSHIAIARKRIEAARKHDHIELRVGSATDIPFGPDSFDKIVALESAFQFQSREQFFREARRVLRPGGRLALVEPLPMAGHRHTWLDQYIQRCVVAIPKANFYPRETYEQKLRQTGFCNVQVTSIGQHVYAPFMRYLRRRIDDPDIVRRVNPMVRGFWKGWINSDASAGHTQDYVLAVADKAQTPSASRPR
jgi:ubiquinone/menaquinone biosynthesis C-methylase UbiE